MPTWNAARTCLTNLQSIFGKKRFPFRSQFNARSPNARSDLTRAFEYGGINAPGGFGPEDIEGDRERLLELDELAVVGDTLGGKSIGEVNADIALDEAKRYLCGRHFGRDARMSGHQATSVFLFERIARKNHEFCFTTIFLSDGVIPCDRVLTAGD